MNDSEILELVTKLTEKALRITELLLADDESALEPLEEYVEQVSTLIPRTDSIPQDELVTFEKAHKGLLDAAQNSKGEISRRLQALVVRGKGLKAYVDPLPKRISFGSVKKG